MRMNLSREEETRISPSETVGLVSMNAIHKQKIERIGYRVRLIRLADLHNNQSNTILSIFKEWLNYRIKKIEHYWFESNTKEKIFTLVLFLSDYVF